jgi:hypothetical protein
VQASLVKGGYRIFYYSGSLANIGLTLDARLQA